MDMPYGASSYTYVIWNGIQQKCHFKLYHNKKRRGSASEVKGHDVCCYYCENR